MNLTCLLFGILFTVVGGLFMAGKLHTHIEAWKTMPQEEKDKIKIEELCRNIGLMIVTCGVIFLLSGVSAAFKARFFVAAMVLWLAASFVDVWYIEKKGRYNRP